jgi:hypothetical protein
MVLSQVVCRSLGSRFNPLSDGDPVHRYLLERELGRGLTAIALLAGTAAALDVASDPRVRNRAGHPVGVRA